MGAFSILSLLIAVVALAVAAAALHGSGAYDLGRLLRPGRKPAKVVEPTPEPPLPTDVAGLRAEVAALREETHHALRHLAVVRYDAFDDVGGHLSWSAAMLDDSGSGVVITAINARAESRTYAKSITGWTAMQQLSPEEEKAVEQARPKARQAAPSAAPAKPAPARVQTKADEAEMYAGSHARR
ncbi:MAG: DUF4446 family protein [Nocardioides sp.]|nr:DUF4446 family protein [Nocardioides sp.]